jgi:hypothetical protein
MQHKMSMTDLDHCRTRCCTAFIILAVPAIPAMPGVGAFHHPAFLQRREAACARRPHLHFDAPACTRLRHPGVQRLVVILLIRKDRGETWKVLRRDEAEHEGSRYPIIQAGTGKEDGSQPPSCLDPQMPLAPVDLLAALIPTLGTAHLGGLDRLTIDARSTRGGLASRGHTSLLAQGGDDLGPGPVVAPLGKVFLHRTLRQQVVR